MNNNELYKNISLLVSAYFQYLLYKNNAIKSSSLSKAGTNTDIDRKLSYFIKTKWKNILLENEDYCRLANPPHISNGRVFLDSTQNGYGDKHYILSTLIRGYIDYIRKYIFLLDTPEARNDSIINIESTYSNGLMVTLNSQNLIGDILLNNDEDNESSNELVKSNIKEKCEISFEKLVDSANCAKGFLDFLCEVNELFESSSDNNEKCIKNKKINFEYIFYTLIALQKRTLYRNASLAPFRELCEAMDITYTFAKTNNMLEELFSKEYYTSYILYYLNHLFGNVVRSTSRDTYEYDNILNSLKLWVENISIELRKKLVDEQSEN